MVLVRYKYENEIINLKAWSLTDMTFPYKYDEIIVHIINYSERNTRVNSFDSE